VIPDTNKFFELLKPHYNDALRYCKALCSGKSKEESEDVLQQSLLQAMENFGTLKDTDKFKSWMFKIITRVHYDSFRKSFWRKFQSIEMYESRERIPAVYSLGRDTEDRQLISAAFAKLTEKERAAILLFEIADFSIDEIAIVQEEMSISAVKSRLSRTREKLRGIILNLESKKTFKKDVSELSQFGDVENETIKILSEIETNSPVR